MTLAHDRHGAGRPVVLLHGWPGDRTDYRSLVPLLAADCDVVVPDLRGFGASSPYPDGVGHGADEQARDVIGLISELDLVRPVLAGYDIGSRIAQAVARARPDLVAALVISPPVPGVGQRILSPRAIEEFWYQQFHRLDLVEEIVDGRPDAVRAYLRHIWTHWSGPDFVLTDEHLEHLVSVYGAPGAFVASVGWYRAGSGAVARSLTETTPAPDERIAAPTTVLWPSHDPLFPPEWSDRVDDYFADARVRYLDGVGHFTPLEAPDAFAAAIDSAA
jgi:pimeloyl-ACP methyl ester carboxylesterase